MDLSQWPSDRAITILLRSLSYIMCGAISKPSSWAFPWRPQILASFRLYPSLSIGTMWAIRKKRKRDNELKDILELQGRVETYFPAFVQRNSHHSRLPVLTRRQFKFLENHEFISQFFKIKRNGKLVPNNQNSQHQFHRKITRLVGGSCWQVFWRSQESKRFFIWLYFCQLF